MTERAHEPARARWRGKHWLLVLPAGAVAVYWQLWFLLLPFGLAAAWRLRTRPTLRTCLVAPLALANIWYAVVLVSLPIDLLRAQRIGADICAMATQGRLANVTVVRPPTSLNLGRDVACILRELQPYLRPECTFTTTLGTFASYTDIGYYALELKGSSGALDLELYRHPVLGPALNATFEMERLFDFEIYAAAYGGSMKFDSCAGSR